VRTASFSPDARLVTSEKGPAHLPDVHFATMSTDERIAVTGQRRLRGSAVLSRDEMRLAGSDTTHF
jgi:hypothetical protein